MTSLIMWIIRSISIRAMRSISFVCSIVSAYDCIDTVMVRANDDVMAVEPVTSLEKDGSWANIVEEVVG